MFFFFNDTATTEIYTLSLHDALPIYAIANASPGETITFSVTGAITLTSGELLITNDLTISGPGSRSEEHTSELQSHSDLVCRLLLEKKKRCCRHALCPVTRRI